MRIISCLKETVENLKRKRKAVIIRKYITTEHTLIYVYVLDVRLWKGWDDDYSKICMYV